MIIELSHQDGAQEQHVSHLGNYQPLGPSKPTRVKVSRFSHFKESVTGWRDLTTLAGNPSLVLSLHIVSPVPLIHELSASANTRHADGAHSGKILSVYRIQILKNRGAVTEDSMVIDHGWLLNPQGQFDVTVVHLVWRDLKSSQSKLS